MRILVINGPNLNRLGRRKADHYGTLTLSELEKIIRTYAEERSSSVHFFQSNHEGAIIDQIHGVEELYDGVIINPGAYTHYSYAIRDAIESVTTPFVEVHLSDIHQREPFRAISVTAPVCRKQIAGLKEQSYLRGIDFLLEGQHET